MEDVRKKSGSEPIMVEYPFNPSIQKAEAGRALTMRFLFFFKDLFIYCLYSMPTGQKGAPDLITDGFVGN